MTSTFWLSSKQGVPIEIFATSKNAPPPAASLHFVIFMSTRIHHFLFARESSENLQIFRTYVQDSLRARQKLFASGASAVPSHDFRRCGAFSAGG